MTASRGQNRFFTGGRHRLLLASDRRGRLEGDAKENVFAVTDAALDAAGIIRLSPDFSLANFECVVVLRSAHPRRRKTGADLETLRRRQAQHRFRQIGFQFVEDRFAEAGRDAARDAAWEAFEPDPIWAVKPKSGYSLRAWISPAPGTAWLPKK